MMKNYSARLNQCIAALPDIREIVGNYPDIVYNNVCFDSRKVTPGSIYVALSGTVSDGHDYIPDAVRNGACAVIGSSPLTTQLEIPYIRVADTRLAMAFASAVLYDFPSRDLNIVGVTGTDGKTTTSIYLFNILKQAGIRTGLISTVSAVIGDQELDTGFHTTTPDSPDIQKYLAQMRDEGITHVVLETTSHGLAQERVAAIDFDIAVVTNITHEHLDYHRSREAYFAAKGKLFQKLGESKNRRIEPLAILNKDNQDSYEFLRKLTNERKIAYSATGDPKDTLCRISSLKASPAGLDITIEFKNLPDGSLMVLPVHTQLLGFYNAANLSAAMCAAIYGFGIDPQIAANGIARVNAVPGRMELIDYGQDFTAIVDFAHTPNALKESLKTAHEMLPVPAQKDGRQPRVIAVYGSAGLRDREKRRMMPQVSSKYSDITILTAEDPRTEPLNDILREMADEAINEGAVMNQTLFVEPDRRKAIRLALELAKTGDIVLSLGKGHEQSMCFGSNEFLWDDRTAMRSALCAHLGISGPAMPFLPEVDPYLA